MTRPLLHSQEGAVSPCAPGLKHCLNTSSLRRPASGFATNALECNDLSVRWQGDAAPPALTGGCRFNLRTCSKTLSQHLQPRHECLGVLALVLLKALAVPGRSTEPAQARVQDRAGSPAGSFPSLTTFSFLKTLNPLPVPVVLKANPSHLHSSALCAEL